MIRKMSRVIIVGGGAAGMMAAYAAAESGHKVLLLEQNEKLGKKLYITGKGRCNVTNACEQDKFFENIVSNPKFLYSAFYDFDNRRLMHLLNDAGCKLKVERGERVFPVSDHASDVTAALQRLLQKKRVEIRLHTKVKRLLISGKDGEEIPMEDKQTVHREDIGEKRIRGVQLSDGTQIEADAVVLATGGLSYPTTGSTGDGFRMAEQLGHMVRECTPALTPMEIEEQWCASLQGLSLKNVTLTMQCGTKKIWQGFGEMLFTHYGISGPLVLSASSYYDKCKDKSEVTITVDLKPALTMEQLDKRILRDFEDNPNKQFKNVISGLYPAKLSPVVIELSGIDGEKKIHEVTRQERTRLAEITKQLKMRVVGLRDFTEAIITQGGIKVKEVNPSTMESTWVDGLYFAGEILDVDALTGGFNLQIAWSTGYLAGSSAVGEKNERYH